MQPKLSVKSSSVNSMRSLPATAFSLNAGDSDARPMDSMKLHTVWTSQRGTGCGADILNRKTQCNLNIVRSNYIDVVQCGDTHSVAYLQRGSPVSIRCFQRGCSHVGFWLDFQPSDARCPSRAHLSVGLPKRQNMRRSLRRLLQRLVKQPQ